MARLKVLKGKWYVFQANFRRDKAYFDYDLLDNPLNAPSAQPAVGYTISPHLTDLTRKNQDYSLNLFPVSRFKVRLGYSFGDQYGTTFSSSHMGAEPDYTRPWRTTTNTYRAGFTYKLFQGTSVSYDHVLTHFKNDTGSVLQNQLFTLNGRPLDLGVAWAPYAPYNAPCANAITAGGSVNPVCNGYYNFTQFEPLRSDIPTDTVAFSSSFRRLDMTGSVFYSGGEAVIPTFNEFVDGLTTRTNTRLTTTNGNMFNRRVASGAEFGASLRINDHLRLVETFRWDAYRIPSGYAFNQANLFGATLTTTPVVWDPSKCPSPYTAATCPMHTTSSSADQINEIYSRFEGDDLKSNQVALEFNANRHFGGHVGFKYDAKTITLRASDVETQTYYPGGSTASAAKTSGRNALCVGSVVNASGVCTVTSQNLFPGDETYEPTTKGAIAGFWFRPSDKFRASFDLEALNTDKPFTVIAPKSFQLYRVKSRYQPKDWFSFAFALNMIERSNDDAVNNKQHNRSVSLDTSLNPNGRYGLDLSYQYTTFYAGSQICYYANPNTLNSPLCPVAASTYYTTYFVNSNQAHFGSFNFTFKPAARVRGSVGYTLTNSNGAATLTSVYQSLGGLDSVYHMPAATFEVDLNKSLTWRTAWNYYGYEEGSYNSGATLPRDARGNVFTLSLRYKIGQR